MRPDRPRSPLAGPATGPTAPFPIQLSGPIVKGFGRGSKELGIPTANIPVAGLSVGGHDEIDNGVYYGWAGVNIDDQGRRRDSGKGEDGSGGEVWAMVMSIGFNPYYDNTVRSVVSLSLIQATLSSVFLIVVKEVHILNSFPQDFYGARMNLLILGFIRPEYDYVSKESLIQDIRSDIDVARKSLEREPYARFKLSDYLLRFDGEGHENVVAT